MVQSYKTYEVNQQTMVQRLVTVVQILQVQILCSIIGARAKMFHASHHLSFNGSHGRRNKATNSKAVSLTVREGKRLVPKGIVQDINATLPGAQRLRIFFASCKTANIAYHFA